MAISVFASAKPQQKSIPYGPPSILATIKDKSINESSGLVASRTTPGAYWTHNDSGDGPFIYAIDTHGNTLGIFRVTGAQNRDWEDIAAGPGPQPNKSYLYIADIGDNDNLRPDVTVYRVAEPTLSAATRNFTKARPGLTEPAEAIRLKYPDGSHDAEALLVHPTTGNIYIVIKVVIANPAVYEAVAPFTAGKLITMKRIGEVHVPSLFGGVVTGGSVSPDGRRVALCDYFQGYEMSLPASSTNFDDIWKQRMTGFDLGKREQGESIAYRLDGKGLLATSEGKQSPLIQVLRN
ncbi:MAG TPA: hypothetical protein VF088_17435 [Pyrinomonadaceae bacterium]